MKGRYATRAANRLAQLDNELTNGLQSKVKQLEAELSDMRAQLENEQRQRNSLILNYATNGRCVADMLIRYLGCIRDWMQTVHPPENATQILDGSFGSFLNRALPILIPNDNERATWFGGRSKSTVPIYGSTGDVTFDPKVGVRETLWRIDALHGMKKKNCNNSPIGMEIAALHALAAEQYRLISETEEERYRTTARSSNDN
jgi:hypothetical protein